MASGSRLRASAISQAPDGCILRQLAFHWLDTRFENVEGISHGEIFRVAGDPGIRPKEPAFAFAFDTGFAWVVEAGTANPWSLDIAVCVAETIVGDTVNGAAPLYYFVHPGVELWPALRELDAREGIFFDEMDVRVEALQEGCACALGKPIAG